MNPSHHGSDEQVFGAPQQVLGGGKGKTSILPMNGGSTKGNDGGVPENFTRSERGCPPWQAWVNPSRHGSDEQWGQDD
jgi:hypothetical protein